MSGKTSSVQLPLSLRAFYGESPAKRTRFRDLDNNGSGNSSEGNNSININSGITCNSINQDSVSCVNSSCNNRESTDIDSCAPSASVKTTATSTTAISGATNATISSRPAFKSLKDNLIKFDKKLSEPVKSTELKPSTESQEPSDEPKISDIDRDSPLPLRNLGNTCYENSIIQCLFSLNTFMDNFELSMRRLQRVVANKSKKLGPQPAPITSYSTNEELSTTPATSPNNSHGTLSTSNHGTNQIDVSDNDVRYRIADAFYNLYKSYTKKRVQAETTSSANTLSSTGLLQPKQQLDHQPDSLPQAFAKKVTNEVDLSSDQDPQIESTDENMNPNDLPSASSADHQQHTADSSSNLTPIALVSSSVPTSEQSEIETRLEELKSAVGERSSQFNSTHQQDASEFFYHVIDSIQEFYQGLDKKKDDDNPVTKAFELELDYMIKCPKCNHQVIAESEKIRTLPLALPHANNESSNDQSDFNLVGTSPTPPNSDLGFDSPKSNTSDELLRDLPEEKDQASVANSEQQREGLNDDAANLSKTNSNPDEKSERTPRSSSIKRYTLCDALNNYLLDDPLEYSCSQPGCDSKQRIKKCLIRKLPQILFITLARYSYTGKKNLDEVEAPFELSVPLEGNRSPNQSPSTHRDLAHDGDKYRLVAVVCHLGSSLNAGHYTSYVYNQNNLAWYSCDDDSITKVHDSDVKTETSKSGYCFFYARRSHVRASPVDEGLKEAVLEKSAPHKVQDKDKQVLPADHVSNSSVVLTPASSPKSSFTFIQTDLDITRSDAKMHETHDCTSTPDDGIDDWS